MNGDMLNRVIKGKYKLVDERGRGSFATVYIARDTENNCIYAIKIDQPVQSTADSAVWRGYSYG